MPPADNTPNFDAMTPEEIMAWMESLAKRQGAEEGFTTSADMEIAEIDPDSVVIDEPGYVPSEGKFKGQKITGNMPTAKAEPPPPPATEIAPPTPMTEPAPVPESEPILEPSATTEPEPIVSEGSMSWLESLAADQGVEFPDLSSLGAELAPTVSDTPATNPVDWLESLSQNQGEDELFTPAATTDEPALEASGDPMAWLESLAKRQGADEEELTTEANLDIPLPETWSEDGPGYTDYSFETPSFTPKSSAPTPTTAPPEPARELDPTGLEDPAAWLDSLASAQGFDSGLPKGTETAETPVEALSDDEIQAALARGEVVPHDQMEAWMNRQLEIGAQRDEPEELSAYDPDAPAVPAELPDWLLDQVGQAPPPEETPTLAASSEPPPLLDMIFEPPAAENIPDWLKEEPEASELDSIFANTLEEDQPVLAPPPQEVLPAEPQSQAEASTLAMEIDTNDPWVEAFDQEYEQGRADINQVPEWYERNVNDPERLAAVERIAGNEPAAELQEANLQPETELPLGEPESVPDWLQETTSADSDMLEPADIPDWLTQDLGTPPAVSQPVVEAEAVGMQDWLQSIDVEATEIPDWLMDTLSTSTSEQPNVVAPTPEITPEPVQAVVPIPTPGYSPAPVPVQAVQIDIPETLNNARSRASVNDIDSSLQNYELLIRANAELEAVVEDLGKLAEKFKTTPAVFRVLGDGLMRQGKLQAALDTYRKALNQL